MSGIFPTGTPWQTAHDFDLEGQTTIIGNVDGEIIDGSTHHTYDFICRTIDKADDSQSLSIAVANAALIVRAVNSHEGLVKAARLALPIIKLERAAFFDCHTVCGDPASLSKEEALELANFDVTIRAIESAIDRATLA